MPLEEHILKMTLKTDLKWNEKLDSRSAENQGNNLFLVSVFAKPQKHHISNTPNQKICQAALLIEGKCFPQIEVALFT